MVSEFNFWVAYQRADMLPNIEGGCLEISDYIAREILWSGTEESKEDLFKKFYPGTASRNRNRVGG